MDALQRRKCEYSGADGTGRRAGPYDTLYFREAEMICGSCSQQVNTEARFCSHCGKPMQARAWYSGPIVRPLYGRRIAGVCAGVADHLGVDRGLVRLIAALLLVCGHVFVLVAYLVAWFVLPNGAYYVTPNYPFGYPGANYAGAPPTAAAAGSSPTS